MKKPNEKRRRPAKSKKDKHRNDAIPVLRVQKGASLKAVYAAARRAFTEADLQKYTEVEVGIPAGQVLAELESVDREETRSRKSKDGRSR